MYTNIFTLKDLKQFLSTQGFNWTGKIGVEKISEPIKATNQDLENSSFQTLVITDDNQNEFYLDVNLTNFIFITFDNIAFTNNSDQDLSSEWQNFLLNKYQEEYARILLLWSQNCKEFVLSGDRHEIARFNAIASKAQRFLSNDY